MHPCGTPNDPPVAGGCSRRCQKANLPDQTTRETLRVNQYILDRDCNLPEAEPIWTLKFHPTSGAHIYYFLSGNLAQYKSPQH
jgi:hypothetical protein